MITHCYFLRAIGSKDLESQEIIGLIVIGFMAQKPRIGISLRQSSTIGFKLTRDILKSDIRRVGESRGFAISRVLTHWTEIAGHEMAEKCRPVEVRYRRKELGATLIVLTTGAHAPMLEMQREILRERVNAIYGYNAIVRIKITQTSPTGFKDGHVDFWTRQPKIEEKKMDPALMQDVSATMTDIRSPELRQALERLGYIIKAKRRKET